MLLNHLRSSAPRLKIQFPYSHTRSFVLTETVLQNLKSIAKTHLNENEHDNSISVCPQPKHSVIREIFPTRVVPMVSTNKDTVVLSFDQVPGPKSMKYLSIVRHYLSQIGTQITAGALTLGLNIGNYVSSRAPVMRFTPLFDEYGPVVRFVSPVGSDIVLINQPDLIQKVFTLEGEHPVRSTLDSLEKYRTDHRNHFYGGLYSVHGEEWSRQRSAVIAPLNQCVSQQLHCIDDVCENFIEKVYGIRNYQDEVTKDLYKEIHKWSFDCIGLIIFSKKFTMLDTDLVYSQCDMSWFYHSLEKATEAITKCESGFQLWKLLPTPAWNSLVKYCDNLENLIGKEVMEAEQKLEFGDNKDLSSLTCILSPLSRLLLTKTTPCMYGLYLFILVPNSLINALLLSQEKLRTQDITTVLMDMLLLGVNTISSSMSFLLYHLATHQRVQKLLYDEIKNLDLDMNSGDAKIKEETPYLQACIKETLRLVPPIPVITRILPKNIILDKYNIPSGTLIIMSTLDAARKECNYDDAGRFHPERWLQPEAKDYHSFASIPFGFGARKCLGQNVAETIMSLMTIKLVKKYKLEYHYGAIQPTRSFISRPNRRLKIRLIDRT